MQQVLAVLADDLQPAGREEEGGERHERAGEIAENLRHLKAAHGQQPERQQALRHGPERTVVAVRVRVRGHPAGCGGGDHVAAGIDRGGEENRGEGAVDQHDDLAERQRVDDGHHGGGRALRLEDGYGVDDAVVLRPQGIGAEHAVDHEAARHRAEHPPADDLADGAPP